jgi:hypothetical protein
LEFLLPPKTKYFPFRFISLNYGWSRYLRYQKKIARALSPHRTKRKNIKTYILFEEKYLTPTTGAICKNIDT